MSPPNNVQRFFDLSKRIVCESIWTYIDAFNHLIDEWRPDCLRFKIFQKPSYFVEKEIKLHLNKIWHEMHVCNEQDATIVEQILTLKKMHRSCFIHFYFDFLEIISTLAQLRLSHFGI